MKFKKGDLVLVIAGKNKGIKGHIMKAMPQTMQVIVDGVNFMNKRVKGSAVNPTSSVMKVEHPIHVSNVSHIDPKTGLTTRVGYIKNSDGTKIRISKKTGEPI